GLKSSTLGDVIVVDWNRGDVLGALFERAAPYIAGVIMEPLPCKSGVIFANPGYLEFVRELTSRAGSILIFDEVITGFRVGIGGARAKFGIIPDLAIVARAMANGFPISALGGRAELM